MTNLSKLTWVERVALAGQFVRYGERFVGTSYRWGGDDPMTGFDCSGFVVECLWAVGLLTTDLTANGLYRKFKEDTVQRSQKGCLVLYPRDQRMYHVGIYCGDGLYLTAEGGGSNVKTPEDAAKHNAFVMMRPVNSRENPVFLDIFQLRKT